MKIKLLFFILLLFNVYAAYSQQQAVRSVIKVLNLDLFRFATLEDQVRNYLGKGCIKSDFRGNRNEPKSVSYTSQEYKELEMIYEIFYNDQKEVYKLSLYMGPSLEIWKTYTDEQKMDANITGYANLKKYVTDELGEPTSFKSYAWDPYRAEDLKSPTRFLEGAEANKVGYFANWDDDENKMEFLCDPPVKIRTYSARLVVVSVTDWRMQRESRKAANKKK